MTVRCTGNCGADFPTPFLNTSSEILKREVGVLLAMAQRSVNDMGEDMLRPAPRATPSKT